MHCNRPLSHCNRLQVHAPFVLHMLRRHSLGRAKTDGIYYRLYKDTTARAVLGPSNQHIHDGGTHILSGCQHKVIRKQVTTHHNEGGRTILKAILKGTLGAGLVYADVGSDEKLTAGGISTMFLKIRTILNWLTQNTPNSRPDAIMVIPHTPQRHWSRNTQDLPESERRIILIEIKYCPDTAPHQSKRRTICTRLMRRAMSAASNKEGKLGGRQWMQAER